MTDSSDTALAALIDTLLPGDGDYPPPSRIDLAGRLRDHDRFGPATATVLALLPPAFGGSTAEARDGVLRAIEQDQPDLFGACLTGVYSLYYSDPAVLAVIARTSGYTPRAPQPDGYALAPFDPAVVRIAADRPLQYRTVDGDPNGQ